MKRHPAAAEPATESLPQAVEGWLEIVAARALGDPDDVRDAIQETLARAVHAIREQRVPSDAPLAVFVYGIARHVIADMQRQRIRGHGRLRDVERVAAPGPSALERLVRAEERAAVERALARLPPAERAILQSCFLDGERIVDIAERTGEPAERLRKRKSRALQRLREITAYDTSEHGHKAQPGTISEA